MIVTGCPASERSRAMTCMASRECPPRSKKSSSAPTRSSPSTFAQTSATASSSGVSGGTYPAPWPGRSSSGSGSAALSTLPWDLKGSASSQTYLTGTM